MARSRPDKIGVRWRIDGLKAEGLPIAGEPGDPGKRRSRRRGAFEVGFGDGIRSGRRSFRVPSIVMTAGDAGEFRHRHGDPASRERIARWLRMSLEAWRDGACDGVVTCCLDKAPGSRTFDLSRDLYREFAARPRSGKDAPPAGSR